MGSLWGRWLDRVLGFGARTRSRSSKFEGQHTSVAARHGVAFLPFRVLSRVDLPLTKLTQNPQQIYLINTCKRIYKNLPFYDLGHAIFRMLTQARENAKLRTVAMVGLLPSLTCAMTITRPFRQTGTLLSSQCCGLIFLERAVSKVGSYGQPNLLPNHLTGHGKPVRSSSKHRN
jgi:hypothetical protein